VPHQPTDGCSFMLVRHGASLIILSTSTSPSDLERPDTGTSPVILIQFKQYKYVRKIRKRVVRIIELVSQLLFSRSAMAA